VYLLKVLFINKYRETWQDRLGIFPAFSAEIVNNIIWIHAASAGEVKIACVLIDSLKFSENTQLLVTTSTHSGLKIARTKLGERARVHMLPFDLLCFIGPAVKRINPGLTIIIEADIWPNFIKFAARNGDLLMVNAWYKHKMIKNVAKVSNLLPEVMKYFNKITVQTEYDRQQFKHIINDDKIKVTGNIKYDQVGNNVKNYAKRADLKIAEEERLIIAGSTHENEEEIILKVYKKLKGSIENLLILIAPRHIERSDQILKICRKMNLDAVKKTVLMKRDKREEDVIILDTMGELAEFYSLGILTFIGGTLIEQGGHNILEALSSGNPVIFGPHYYNFRDIFEMAMKKNVGYKITTEKELLTSMKTLLFDNKKLSKINGRAREFIENNKGALNKNIIIIKSYLVKS